MYATRRTDSMALLGRILMSIIFIISACAKMVEWNTTVHMMHMVGIPAPRFFLAIAIIIELAGGLGVLFGVFTRWCALVMLLYLIPVTLVMHSFWSVGPLQMSIQLVNFLKNLAIMGGLALLAGYGPGRYSIGSEKYLYDEEYVPLRTEPTATTTRS